MRKAFKIIYLLLPLISVVQGNPIDSNETRGFRKNNFILVYPITSYLVGGGQIKYERRFNALPLAFSATFNYGYNREKFYKVPFQGFGYEKTYSGFGVGVHYLMNRDVKGSYISVNFMAQNFYTKPIYNEDYIIFNNDAVEGGKIEDTTWLSSIFINSGTDARYMDDSTTVVAESYHGNSQTYQISFLWNYRWANIPTRFVFDIGLGAVLTFSSDVDVPILELDYTEFTQRRPTLSPVFHMSTGFCF